MPSGSTCACESATQVYEIRGLGVACACWPMTGMNQWAAALLHSNSWCPDTAEQHCRSIAVVHTASHTHTQTSKATAAALTPTHVWFESKRIDRREESCSPEECDKELHQIHEVTVLGEGDLWKGKKGQHTESGICFNEADFKTKGQHYTLVNTQALD